jgi:hypothetical protein
MNNQVSQIYKPENDIFGLPQIYKGVSFYPVKINQFELKKKLYRLFFQPKNYILDRTILRMTYLKFILYILQEKSSEINLLKDLLEFLSETTKTKDIELKYKEYPDNPDPFDQFSLHIFINGIEFNEQEFDNIREIVLEQNGSSIEYVESYDPDLENRLFLMNRGNYTDLKDEIYSFCCLTGLLENDVGNLTLYQFKNRFEREMMVLVYKYFKPLEVSGQISSKHKGEEIFRHYLIHISTDQSRYTSIMVDTNKFMKDSGLDNPNSGVKFEE